MFTHFLLRPATPDRCHLKLFAAAALVFVAIVIALPADVFAQRSGLQSKLEELNVRVWTEHYALAGTVDDKALQDYGQMLEYIYSEYEKGFTEVIKSERKEARRSKSSKKTSRDKQRKDNKKQSGGEQSASDPQDDGEGGEGAGGEDEAPRTMAQEDEEGRFRVIIFATKQDYYTFGAEFLLGGTEHTNGVYIPMLKVLLILARGNPADTRRTLFHEAFHQFVHRHIKNPPMWLNEGLAVHYGEARPTRNGLTFSHPDAPYWKLCRKAIEKGRALPLWDVVQAGRREFYDPTPIKLSTRYREVPLSSLYYGEAYTLIHTLLSDETGRERLRHYIRDLAQAEGRNTAKITREYFGPEVCDHMTSFWVKHVNSRPETR
ncbi:MAG: hypothetical protein KAY37_13090 [Phycisphaerae bacterium]|nr:hypothetical protein [Phycisphaerae bacterium]